MTKNIEPKAFTAEYEGIVLVLETQVGICEAYNFAFQQGMTHPTAIQCKAIWDTGAMRSVISTNMVNALNLKPTGKARIFHANGQSVVNTYSINVLLPSKVEFSSLLVTEGDLGDTDYVKEHK